MPIVIYGVPLFPSGQVVATRGAVEKIPELEMYLALNRHLHGDWGDVCEEDKRSNNYALLHGGRLFSAYHTEKDHVKFWIITEADRSVTTVLLPDEY